MVYRLTRFTSLRSLGRAFIVVVWLTPQLAAVSAAATPVDAARKPASNEVNTNAGRSALVAECVEAHAAAQEQRQAGQLLQSRAQFMRCSKQECPEVVRSECIAMLDELRSQIPSATFRISLDGQPYSNVAATMDGKKLFSDVPTRALELDPGRHHFEFRRDGGEPIAVDVTISEGQRLIPVVAEFITPPTRQPRTHPAEPPESEPSTVRTRPVPLPVYVLGAIGVVGLGSFVGFGLATRSKEDELRSSCMPACAPSQIDELERRARIADISLGIGVVGLAAATTYYLLRPTESVQVGAAWYPNARLQSHVQFEF